MKISAFTMVKNADKFYFPIKESILSVLPIVDEFIIALGDNDSDDKTREIIESINSEKLKIYDRVWAEEDSVNGSIYAKETNFALSKCKGDWCLYIQADEVVHEKDLEKITASCHKYIVDKRVDGLLFNYNHFFGDYEHYLPVHGWYKNEIRIIRNNAGIYSNNDAQSFKKGNKQLLNVAVIEPYIYHYGWVRPPELMQSKKKEQETEHYGNTDAAKIKQQNYDYGALGRIPVFKGTHPKVMEELRAKLYWKGQLNYTKRWKPNRDLMKHEKPKYRFITFLEKTFNSGKDFFGYTNWKKIG
jgi:Glycosyl transferase family 2